MRVIFALCLIFSPYKCDSCDKSFAQRSNLMSHKRATHLNDKRYKCETCERSFKRRRLLEYHIKATHTGERPHKCEECQATFVYPEHYKKHIRIHTGVKPFACEKCGKKFASRDNRNAHRFIHTDKKPYECMVCHQSFMRKPLLIAHMAQQQHGVDGWIHNKPDFQETKENNNLRTITNDDAVIAEDDDANVYYVSVNDKRFMDGDDGDGDHFVVSALMHFNGVLLFFAHCELGVVRSAAVCGGDRRKIIFIL